MWVLSKVLIILGIVFSSSINATPLAQGELPLFAHRLAASADGVKTGTKYDCAVCNGPGDDCEPTSVDKDCDYCIKVTGTVDDPKTVPEHMWAMLADSGVPNATEKLSAMKGKRMTIRKGVRNEEYNSDDEAKCLHNQKSYGICEATICQCKGNCH